MSIYALHCISLLYGYNIKAEKASDKVAYRGEDSAPLRPLPPFAFLRWPFRSLSRAEHLLL